MMPLMVLKQSQSRHRLVICLGGFLSLLPYVTGGCECSQEKQKDEGALINRPDLARQIPSAPRPSVIMLPECRQPDPDLNQFIEHTMGVCSRGDYDAYRQLFGTAYKPTAEVDFKRIWQGVKEIVVRRVWPSPEKPPRYYVLADVKLRKPDSKGRHERSVPIMVFQEAGQWRVGPAPKHVIELIRAADSQPAEDKKSKTVTTEPGNHS